MLAIPKKEKSKGYIAIITVLIILIVMSAIVTTVSLSSIGELQSSWSQTKGEDALSFVESCAEDALLKAKASDSYNGGNITRPEGVCSVTITSKVGSTWTMVVTTTASDYKRTIEVIFNRGSFLTITSWQEI